MAWSTFAIASTSLAERALSWLVQSSFLLAGGLLAGGLLRKAGSAVESAVYRTTLVAVLLCPFVSVVLGAVGLEHFRIRLRLSVASGTDPRATAAAGRHPAGIADVERISRPDRQPNIPPGAEPPLTTSALARAPEAPSPPSSAATMEPDPSIVPSSQGLVAVASGVGLVFWLLGSTALAMRLFLAEQRMARLRSSGVPAESPVLALCQRLAEEMQVARPTILRTAFLSSPCLDGLRTPAILLPESDDGSLRETLIHELAHLARRDPFWNLLRRCGTALLCGQPLLWLLSRRMEVVAEEVCDDFVVQFGADRAEYAGFLLELAERTLPPVAPASVGMVALRSLLARRVIRILDSSRGLSTRVRARTIVLMLLTGLAGTLLAGLVGVGGPLPASRAGEEPSPSEGVTFAGRVIDKAGGKPISGATIVVVRSIYGVEGKDAPAWVGKTVLKTDAEGRFTLTFSPEQVAKPRLFVALERIAHPDFIVRRGYDVPVMRLVRERKFGGKPFFETVTLERGMEFFGQVVTPEGDAAVGVPLEFGNWGGRSNLSPHFANDDRSQTDGNGRFRLRMARSQALTITVKAERYAPIYRFWGTDRLDENSKIWAPADLGRLVLKPGPVLKGRLVDVRGRGIPGQIINAHGTMNQINRSARTDDHGEFAFAPLLPGNYLLHGEGQSIFAGVDYTRPPMPSSARVIKPIKVYLKDGVAPDPVVLHEAPSVSVELRFIDAMGRPARGNVATLTGIIPNAQGKADPFGVMGGRRTLPEVNEPEPEDASDRIDWTAQGFPDEQGRLVFRAPRGLQHSDVYTVPPDETIAFKTRLNRGGPLKYWGGGQLGTLDADRTDVEVVSYRAPTVLVNVKTDEGEALPDAQVRAGFTRNGGGYADGMIKQADGRYRGLSLMPDHEYELTAWAPGWVPSRIERVNLPEGAATELTLVVRRQPKPPSVGDQAPPFLVKTLDGQVLSAADLKGKVVLLHFWSHVWNRGTVDLPHVKVVHDRFGKDERLVMINLALVNETDAVADVVKQKQYTWPQAVLRDRNIDPIVQAYGAWPPPRSVLIGQDGKLIANDLHGDKVIRAVADALGKP